ncbi:MAG: VOC family protein [Phycisphaeraceae bacterium]|nr:VOC family protein [Phycisphaeraceae bacterium]
MTQPSPIEFPGNNRIHLALAVTDLQRSLGFYETLLGTAPAKVRPGYAKFEPEDPSVNLTLNEVSQADPIGKPATHYGVQVKSTDAVHQAVARLSKAGLAISVEENTTCCFAVQDKAWVTDPDGNSWEVFVVLEADAPQNTEANTNCCNTSSEQSTGSACCA